MFPFEFPISFIFDDDGTFIELEGEYLEREDQHCIVGQGFLIEQYKEKPRLAELLCIWLDQVQDLENAAWRCATERSVDTAIGAQLDQIGVIVGQPRLGLDDEDYRPLIRARVLANRSEGTVGDLYAVARAAMGVETGSGEVDPYYPASVYFWVGAPLDFGDAILFDLLRDSVMGGVRLIVIFLVAPLASSFVFGWSGNAPEESATQGFGWSGDPGLGGVLSFALG